MKIQNKKVITTSIFIITLLLLFSTFTYAKPFTDAFRGGLLQINDFFVNEQYKPYSATIDFFFFALLFIAIYMMGARYAFKEVKKPEQVIVILLGLMTAFLLVLGGFSATVILPYMQWLLYTLLFILYFWLLKGIKNRFWRFILALLLTLLTIGLFQGLFSSLTAPDAEGFFKSLGGSFGGIEFPGLPGPPGVPSYLQDLFGAPSVTTPTETGPVTTTETPKETVTQEKGGISWSYVLIPLVAVLALSAGVWKRKELAELLKRRKTTIVYEIEEMITRKSKKMDEVKAANEEKNGMIKAGESRSAIIEKLEDPAYAWEAVRSYQEGHPLKDLYNKELQLITKLKELMDLEKTEFLEGKLSNWQARIMRETGFDDAGKQSMMRQLEGLRNLVTHKTTIRNIRADIRNMGILWLIVICNDFEKREIMLNMELDNLLREHNVQTLIRDKFAKVKENKRKLHRYSLFETGIIIKVLEPKIQEQIGLLNALKNRLQGGQGTQTPTTPQGTPVASSSTPPSPKETEALLLPHITLKIEQPLPNSKQTIGSEIDDLNVRTEDSLEELMKICDVMYYHWSLTGVGINNTPIINRPVAIKIIKPSERTKKYGIPEIFTEQKYAALKVRLIGKINKKMNILGEQEINIELVKPPETKGIFITINKPQNDPKGRKPFYLNENIEFSAIIANLEIPVNRRYPYAWFEQNPETLEFNFLKQGVTLTNNVIDTIPASLLGLGKHSIYFNLGEVFRDSPTSPPIPHGLSSSPITIHIISPRGIKALKAGPERKLLGPAPPEALEAASFVREAPSAPLVPPPDLAKEGQTAQQELHQRRGTGRFYFE